ncbi:hypothetical protein JCM10908_001084 [Rhodotorula pacifica]|uniref:uncharacterized protein n=1 Tax=Rhodotorula pacifica TaxID=1495444 RepID=UPI00316D779E
MALVSPSPPPSASLYPASSAIYSHSSPSPAEVRAPLVAAAPKVGTSTVARHTASTHGNGSTGNGNARRDEQNAGKTAVDDLAAGTGALALTEGLERSHASTSPNGRSATAQQAAHTYSATEGRGPSRQEGPARLGTAASGVRSGPLSGFQSRSASTPISLNRHSPAPSSSSITSSSSSSIQQAANAYSASSSSAASSSTSFLPASTPALTPLTPMHFSAAGASPAVSSPQSYFAVAPLGDQRFANGQFPSPTHYSGQSYPSHSSSFPNPAFPFMPSPHPGVPHMSAFGGSQMGMPSPQMSQDQHALFLQYQQQWQMEMLKTQQQQQANAHGYETGTRRRATSGPAAHQPQAAFHSTPPSYPPSPAPSFQKQTLHAGPPAPSLPTLPPGAMLPQYATHGYPTPPTSHESSSRGGSGGESSASSTGSAPSRAGEASAAYHPYRREDHRRHGSGAHSASTDSSSRSQQYGHRATSSNGSAASRSYGRMDSSTSSFGPGSLPTTAHTGGATSRSASSSSVTSLGGTSNATAGSVTSRPSGLPAPAADSPPFPRSRTSSQNSTSTSAGSRPASGLRQRHDSGESGRSSTPVQLRARTSPLSAVPHNEGEDDSAESDATAEATETADTGLSASSTMTSLAGAASDSPAKDAKGGMKSRFRKAFGVSNSPSSNTLTEADLVSGGPKQVQPSWRPRTDSDNSSNASNPPRLPYATHAGSVSGGASSILNDGASTTTSRRPPSSNRFRLMNGKFNGSSDNLSISSTVSSASMMIRKIGQMGKLARRNSLMGLTKAFKKDKSKDDDAAVERDVASAAKLTKKDKKKGGVASASVSHVTAESDTQASQATAGMSPAAALARKQQLAYAEREAAEERAQQAAAAEAARLRPPKRSFEQLSSHQRSNSAASDASSINSSQTLDKKNRKGFGFKNRFGLGGSKTDLRETASINDAASTYSSYSTMAPTSSGQYDDATPRQSLEVLAPPQASYNSYGAREYGTDSQEYEPSLYREGAEPKRFARTPKGILKGAGTYRQEDYVQSRPQYRNRASSFDAPQQLASAGLASGPTALVNAIPSEQQVDGVTAMQTEQRADTQTPTDREVLADAVAARVHPETVSSGPYSHTGMNASAPALNHFSSLPSLRPTSPAAPKRRIVFASSLSVHTTWPANIYDRRAEPATCNRLTPLLAQQIKEELNSFKMEEMAVHPLSRRLTHFCESTLSFAPPILLVAA